MLRIEKLKYTDVERLKKIRLRSLKESPDAFESTFEELVARPETSWVEQLQDLTTFVAVKDDEDGGIVRGAPQLDRNDLLYLISMWVAPEFRGTGVGDALIDVLVSWATVEGYKRILLDVGDFNKHAIYLYERKGFRVTGKSSIVQKPHANISEIEMALGL